MSQPLIPAAPDPRGSHDLAGSARGRGWMKDLGFEALALATVCGAMVMLGALIVDIAADGLPRLGIDFIRGFPSRRAEQAGIWPALVGSLYLMLITAAVSFPVGVAAAIYLEEYAPQGRLTRFIELNIANLAGVPSIVYGLLGLAVFVRAMGLERSLISGGLTLAMLVLPVIIMSSREALRAVPHYVRDASLALGATKWQTMRRQVLPISLPGIMTGTILALSRAIGETAPIVMIGAFGYISHAPDGLKAPFTALPIQIYSWVSRPQQAAGSGITFQNDAAAAILVLLAMLLTLNAAAIWVRNRAQRRLK